MNAKDGGDRQLKTDEDNPRDRRPRTNQLSPRSEIVVEEQSCVVAVVGAGAAGLATAIFTRRLNPSRPVVVFDSAARPGAKILVSGGSRCNVTNVQVSERDFSGGTPSIIRRVLRAFPPPQVIDWFRSIGVPLHEEADGKIFPDSNKSRDVLNALLAECKAAGVDLRSATRVEKIEPSAASSRPESSASTSSFTLHTIRSRIQAAIVVMATGGLSLPKTGSDGHGLSIATSLGHTIVPTTPALAPLIASDDSELFRTLTGVSQEVEIVLWIDDSIALRLRGSLLWTHFGLSGPVVLDMSRHWLRARLDRRDARVTINLIADKSFESLEQDWTHQTTASPRSSIHSILAGTMPSAVAAAVLERVGLEGSMLIGNLRRADRRRLIHALTEWPANIVDSRGYNYAEATAGGVSLDEIDPATMQSRRCPGLYLVGEMLDVDGRIGGFNFQWAWCSARVAGRALALVGGV